MRLFNEEVKKSSVIKACVAIVLFVAFMIWCGEFSPWAKAYNREFTAQEVYKMAVEYDNMHGTHFADEYHEAAYQEWLITQTKEKGE